MRTKSSNTKACGDWANCTQSFGSLCCVGSNILPSLFHFIALIAYSNFPSSTARPKPCRPT